MATTTNHSLQLLHTQPIAAQGRRSRRAGTSLQSGALLLSSAWKWRNEEMKKWKNRRSWRRRLKTFHSLALQLFSSCWGAKENIIDRNTSSDDQVRIWFNLKLNSYSTCHLQLYSHAHITVSIFVCWWSLIGGSWNVRIGWRTNMFLIKCTHTHTRKVHVYAVHHQ